MALTDTQVVCDKKEPQGELPPGRACPLHHRHRAASQETLPQQHRVTEGLGAGLVGKAFSLGPYKQMPRPITQLSAGGEGLASSSCLATNQL